MFLLWHILCAQSSELFTTSNFCGLQTVVVVAIAWSLKLFGGESSNLQLLQFFWHSGRMGREIYYKYVYASHDMLRINDQITWEHTHARTRDNSKRRTDREINKYSQFVHTQRTVRQLRQIWKIHCMRNETQIELNREFELYSPLFA